MILCLPHDFAPRNFVTEAAGSGDGVLNATSQGRKAAFGKPVFLAQVRKI